MKALIVDDEQHVREAIRLLTDWQKLGITELLEADNGQSAAELIDAAHPELLLTDMRMPIQDGVKLLEYAQKNYPQMQKIVISGHTDFELVRSTMKFGGLDYLLKPIDPTQLSEALTRAVASWHQAEEERQSNHKRSMQMNQIKPVYWDKIMSGLIANPPEYPVRLRSQLIDEFGEGVTEECRVAIISLDSAADAILNRFLDNRDLLFFSLANIANEFLRRSNRGLACRNWNSDQEVLVLVWSRTEELPLLLRQISDGVLQTFGTRLMIGVGSTEPFPAGAARSAKEARTTLIQRNMQAKNHWIHTECAASGVSPMLRLTDRTESFRLALLSGRREEIAKAVATWFMTVEELPCITWEQVLSWGQEWETLLTKLRHSRLGTDPVAGGFGEKQTERSIPLHADGSVDLGKWADELTASLEKLLGEQERSQREKGSMKDIARYLEEHYSRDLSLQDIADHFYLSREYISRRFKQEFQENLSDYLGRVRIGKAKLLLQNPNLRIIQIAEMVGYPDEKYFSKVFKKLEGKTPGEFRREL